MSEHVVRAGDQGLASRIAAADILFRVDRESAYADVLLGAHLPDFAPADRRLITRLVLGTIAWQGRLDYELKQLTRRELIAIQPVALEILRMGLFQLRFLDRIPQHAVVDTAVSIAKRNVQARRAAGFVNAVMRRATRETAPMPPRERNEKSFLAIAYSHPRWLVERFVDWFGLANAERLMTANNNAAPNVLRLNLARGARAEIIEKLSADGFEIGADGRAPETIVLKSAPRFESRAYRDGLFHAQSETSQIVARMLAPRAGATVVDCAAAPGGKATHLAEMIGEHGRVIAMDLNFNGLKNARDLARRLRHRNIEFVCADLTAAAPLAPLSVDYVLLDAPCTGLGTLREHPEIKWRMKPTDPARMAAIQSRMLEHAATLVRSGGAIVYSVCSIAPDEGECVVDGFLARHDDFEIDRAVAGRDEFRGVIDARGFIKTRPDVGGLDGFFAARLIRR
ncbi:MAG TPA: 16S rRNA (cytosine(967)-C(5))-methyltransferase RsmB [Candidatus Binatus sp.]|uniref:16S rRNA (cytosine(967)-C(5))-methyltransferase RsmB n=1 Tax=Candidatus Binatus sp. TaxID=2811406 RepID=UPI002F42B32F